MRLSVILTAVAVTLCPLCGGASVAVRKEWEEKWLEDFDIVSRLFCVYTFNFCTFLSKSSYSCVYIYSSLRNKNVSAWVLLISFMAS